MEERREAIEDFEEVEGVVVFWTVTVSSVDICSRIDFG
jgi:hypothetical protein